MTKHSYPYLRNEFLEFITRRTGHLNKIESMRSYFDQHLRRKLYQKIGLSSQEVFEQFIAPWQKLDIEQAQAIAQLWNWHFHEEHNQFMEITALQEPKALYWTVVNIQDLKLFDLFKQPVSSTSMDFLAILFDSAESITPYKQCRFCGRLDRDPRGKQFSSNSLYYCHLDACEFSDGNPSAHQEGCCFRIWAQEKQNLRLRLNRHRHSPDDIKQIFQEFCQKRYIANQAIQTPVRIRQPKPIMNVMDREALQIYQEQ